MNKNKKMLAVLSVPAMASLLAVAVSTPAKAATRDFYDTTTTPATVYANADYTTNADTLNKLITASADHPSSFVYEYAGSFYNYNALFNSYEASISGSTTVANAFAAAIKATPVVPNPVGFTVASVSAINSTQAQVTFSAPVNASSVVPNDFKVTDANGNQLFISKAEVSSTDSKSVILTFFDKFADKAAYTVATSNVQDTKSNVIKATTSSFAYAKAAVTSVQFTATTLPASASTDLSKYIKITDALGRDVTSENSVSFTADKLVTSTGTLTGTPVDGDVAVVKVTVNGTTVTANAVVTFKTQLANSFAGYTIATDPATVAPATTDFSKLSSDKVVHYVSKSDTNEKLGLYYNDQYGNSENAVVGGVTVTNLTPSVVIVDGLTGKITPISTGTGYVQVKAGNVQQTVEIDVRDDASVASLSVDNANVTTVLGTNIPTTVKLTFKDQYGTAIDPSKIDLSKVTTTVNPGDENMLAVAKNGDGTLSLIPLKQGNTSFKIEYKDTTTNVDLIQNVQVSITNAAAVAGYKVEADTTKLDKNAANTADTTDATNGNIKVYEVDTNGNKIKDVTSSATLSFVSGDTLSNELVTFSGQEVNIDTASGNAVSYKPQNATVVVSLGSLQVGTVTFTVDDTTATPATATFTNNAIYGATSKTIDSLLQNVVAVNDQFGSSIASFDATKLSFTYKVTNVNAVNLTAGTINGVSILNNSGTADVVVTGVYYNGGSTNLLAAPQVIKLSVKQQLPIVTNITFNGVSITPTEVNAGGVNGTIDLSQFAGKDIVSATGTLSADSTVKVVAADGTTVLYPTTSVKTTDNFFTFSKDGNIKATTLASLDGAKVTVTSGGYSTVYVLKTK